MKTLDTKIDDEFEKEGEEKKKKGKGGKMPMTTEPEETSKTPLK